MDQKTLIERLERKNNFNELEHEAKDSILNWYQRSSTIENRRDLAYSGLVKI